MIYIEKGQTNKVMLTLWESTTIDNPYYAFRFTNNSTGEDVVFLAADTSSAPERYNLFDIVEQPTGLDPMSAIIELSPAGQWTAEIYESATATLTPAQWGALLQREMVIVTGEDNAINPIYR